MSFLGVRGCVREFAPGARALDGVDLEVRAGETHVLAGANGAGKSTLIRILAGADRPDSGEVLIDGRVARFRGPADASRAGIAVIHQETSLVGALSVTENLFIEGSLRLRKRDEHRRAEELCRAAGLAIDVRRPVGELPLGARAAVEIAKALAREARVLILDEPTASLEGPEALRLLETLSGLRARGRAILYISHKMDEIFRVADRITVLRDGRVAATGLAAEFTPESVVGHMIPLKGRPHLLVGGARHGALRLEVEGLAGARIAARAGEIVGIAGLQGSGKSELLHSIFCGGGRIRLDGRELRISGPRAAIAAGFALVTGDRKGSGLVESMTIADNAALATLPRARLDLAGIRASARADILKLGIRCRGSHQEVGELSGGNQQKVILAKWLRARPRVLLLDEPTRGVDVGAKAEIHRLLREVAAEGVTILLVSSESRELLDLSDRVLVMHRGHVSLELAARDATESKILAAAMGECA